MLIIFLKGGGVLNKFFHPSSLCKKNRSVLTLTSIIVLDTH